MIDEFVKLIPAHLHARSGRVFYSGVEAFEGAPRPLYLLGLNPGGCPEWLAKDTIGCYAQWSRRSAPRNWSAYRDQGGWGNRPAGASPMQKRVQHMLGRLGLDPGAVPSSNVVFARSKREKYLGDEFERLAADCWPFHQAVIEKLGVRVIACLGGSADWYVRERLGANTWVETFVEKNKRKWKSWTHRNRSGLAVVRLSHPSIADWCNPLTDPTELVERALERTPR